MTTHLESDRHRGLARSHPYDSIGNEYAGFRRPDPRIALRITHALGDAKTVVNVGAGTGSYEPRDCTVIAVEPSQRMIQQRSLGDAPVIRASATALPFADAAFDAGMAILTIHHWHDRVQGLRELIRVVRGRIVIVTWDPASTGFWLTEDYFPEILMADHGIFPSIDELRSIFGNIMIQSLPIPHDCVDGFLGAYWRRPKAYLDPRVRQAISTFCRLKAVAPGLDRLRRDLADGSWQQRHETLFKQTELDIGYRLIVRG